MREYIITIKQRLDVKDADLLKDLAMAKQWNKLTVSDEDTEFLGESNRVISYGSIKNGEDNIETDAKEQEYGYVNMEILLPRRDDDRLMHTIVKRPKMDD